MTDPAPPHPDELFNAARRLGDPDARRAYLDQACGGDAAVRERVEALLVAFEQAGSFLESPVAEAGMADLSLGITADQPAAPPLHESSGAVIGSYKLLEQIGEG